MKCAHCNAIYESPRFPQHSDIVMSDDGDMHYSFQCEECAHHNIAIFTLVDIMPLRKDK